MEHYSGNNNALKSELRDIKYQFGEYNFVFKSDNGVFSKNSIDYGSEFLVKTFLRFNNREVRNLLEVNAGYGYIGITLAKILDLTVDLVDMNKRAAHLCKMNLEINKVEGQAYYSEMYDSITDKFDLIITNPPIKAGKKVVLSLLTGAMLHISEDGELWFVMRKNHGAESIKKELDKVANCQVVDRSKGFWVFSVKKS